MYHIPDVNIPLYWVRPQQILSAEAGSHRFCWDMHLKPLDVPDEYPISAIYENTAPAYSSPWVMPGNYIIKLNVDGKTYTQPLKVTMDIRVKTSLSDLQKQYELSLQCYKDEEKIDRALKIISSNLESIKGIKAKIDKAYIPKLDSLSKRLNALITPPNNDSTKIFNSFFDSFKTLFNTLQGADVKPTEQCVSAIQDTQKSFDKYWGDTDLLLKEITTFNKEMITANHPELQIK
jgi:hypothetical protein